VVQWIQKLDLDSALDGGIVELSVDNGYSWQNIFKVPFVYDFYGYQLLNRDTLPGGDIAFSGTDSTWEDIWLCFNLQAVQADTLYLRFTLKSDSINNNREGWMIDNISAHITIVHPVMEVNKDKYLSVYPRMTNGEVNIKCKPGNDNFSLQTADLIDAEGRLVQQFKIGPGDSNIKLNNHANGWYFLKVTANSLVKTYSIWLNSK
jgi:hypothetical protein